MNLRSWIFTARWTIKRSSRPEAYTTAMELKKRGYKVALASSTGPKLIARIMEETGMRPVFDLIVSGGQFKQRQAQSGDLSLYG